ncbi:hypothetical protein SAMN00777080_1025 [Aquiflexum balticum DSM 16537]|uniref:Uncharacterized protein n=1 Tax=Aquiflexum balticum DSM 16537 TaxID=758820 RepID=A0A1W2H0P4_9BACT|nr:hypothetical protein SAMN00777080_1025 [Aquiflexum balticum DSM 16537]
MDRKKAAPDFILVNSDIQKKERNYSHLLFSG